jgi:large subunit ribosomal protein L13
MTKNVTTKTTKRIEIDATEKPFGRLASEVAKLVRGKTSATFAPNKVPAIEVVISHLDKIGITEKKLDGNSHKWFTGYPGGLKSRSWRELFNRKPQDFFLNSVRRMLPANKLRTRLLKLIKFV